MSDAAPLLHLTAKRHQELAMLASTEMRDALAEVRAQRAEVARLKAQQSRVLAVTLEETYKECARCEFGDEGGPPDWRFSAKAVKAAVYKILHAEVGT